MKDRRYLLRVAILAVVYAGVARLGLMMDAVSGFATLVWPPSGIAVGALLVGGRALWPGVALGAFAVNVWVGAPAPAALGIATGNTVEALIGASVLARLPGGFDASLERVRDVIALIVLAACASTTVSATLGVTSLMLAGVVEPEAFVETWRAWWLGDLVGVLVVTPVLLTWGRGLGPRRWLEAAALIACGAAVTMLAALLGGFGDAYLYFLPLIWAAVRFGQVGTVRTTLLISAVSIAGTALGVGPFVRTRLHESLLVLQTFMAVASSTFLLLGAFVAERRRAIERAEREALEQARLGHEREEAVRARDAFISIASHELRSPLSTLQIQIDMLKRALDDGTAPALAPRVRSLGRQVKRLTRLIDGLLDVSRITAGRLDLELEDVDLVAVVREEVARLGEDLRRAGCAVTLRASGPVVGRWDRLRLAQVVTNLLENAIKYGEGRPIEVAVEGDGETGRLVVRDQGEGIAPSDRARIFEPFERLPSEHHAGGFGLGLWIVRQIVEALGGTIHVESDLGAGSTFTVELAGRSASLAEQARQSLPDLSDPASHAADAVLVVEDDADIRETLTDALRSEGYAVACAQNGHEAIDYLRSARPPGVILLDLMMPGMDGPAFIKVVAETPALAGIPVVLLSADANLADKAVELGAAGYLRKPVEMKALLSTVERHCAP